MEEKEKIPNEVSSVLGNPRSLFVPLKICILDLNLILDLSQIKRRDWYKALGSLR